MICAIICLVIFASGYVGKMISLKYKLREECFYVFVSFAGFAIDNISYFSDDIGRIFDKFVLDVQSKYVDDFKKIKELVLSESFELCDLSEIKLMAELKNSEKQEIFHFLKSLGKSCSESQVKMIEGQRQALVKRHNQSLEDKKQKGNIAFKLSVSIGVIVCILIV
ncbi:MAG: hypothetical protein IJW24_01025 [Clostridia bacterium]|nr:hypothetical protein [Clostridia bacterium]